MSAISSYSKVHSLGHKEIEDLFKGPVVIEEKIDGSQFSFGVIDGKLICRSKGAEIHVTPEGEAHEKMFQKAVDTARKLAPQVHPRWIYRCEYISKPKHNVLQYERVPKDHLILFDVMRGPEQFLTPAEKMQEAKYLGLECVPCYFQGSLSDDPARGPDPMPYLKALTDYHSILGGSKIEGVVIKNYSQFTRDGKLATGKLVREDFKEKHKHAWKVSNPSKLDVVESLVQVLRHENRWRKAVQHLKEAGKLLGMPEDIGALIKEVQSDVKAEEEAAIKEALFNYAWPKIARGIIGGLPEWYKRELERPPVKEFSELPLYPIPEAPDLKPFSGEWKGYPVSVQDQIV